MSEYFYQWQDFPMSKKDDRNKDWHIQTTSKEIARVLVQRKMFTQVPIIFPSGYNERKFWIFQTQFAEKRIALKSMNTLISGYSYDKLKETANTGEFVSNRRINPSNNSEVRVS